MNCVAIVDNRLLDTSSPVPSKPSLGWCLAAIYSLDFLYQVMLRVFITASNWVKPILLDRLIGFIQEREQSLPVGFFYLFLLFVALACRSLCETHFEKVDRIIRRRSQLPKI